VCRQVARHACPHTFLYVGCRAQLAARGQGQFTLSDTYPFPLPPDKYPLAPLDRKILALNQCGTSLLGGIQTALILAHILRLPVRNIADLRRAAPVQLASLNLVPIQCRAQFLKAGPNRSSRALTSFYDFGKTQFNGGQRSQCRMQSLYSPSKTFLMALSRTKASFQPNSLCDSVGNFFLHLI
jgi:hypothetical protein